MKFIVSFLLLLVCLGCQKHKVLFEKTDATTTGISFTNQLKETEQENVLAFEYFYNGAGVAAGDLNNDGRVDLYFAGNQVDNKLYINKGDFRFDEVTEKAGVSGRANGWKTGVTLADVNADGWLDIYVSYSGLRPDSLRRNQLFINNHNLTFTDQAATYGLDDAGYSVQANFFDYDRDGDLDCFLINHNLKNYQRKEAAVMRAERDYNAGDKLFRNDNGHFNDVSAQAGIKGNPLGFGLGVSVSDLNGDGYPDIYITNDYVEDDYCYINQRNGTFRDELRERVEHTSYSAMGADVADLNNDMRPDIMTLDMLPESNARQKLLPWPDNWNVYQAQIRNGFWHQNMRNMLQMQQPNGQFAEIGQLAGVAATDWSWGVLLADFDLDGYKDIFISNGILRDFTDADFIKFSDNVTSQPILEQIKQMPSTPTKNYIFRNNHDLTFVNEQAAWGFDEPTTANGCAYADLDNDGDLDIITNNLNEQARVYRNKAQETSPVNYLTVQLKGSANNRFGIGGKVTVETDSGRQVQEYYPTRGFESCSHGNLLFGLGSDTKMIRVTVQWPDGKQQTRSNVKPNQPIVLDYRQAKTEIVTLDDSNPPFFTESATGINYVHQRDSTNSFDNQILLPMQYAATGPCFAVGDVNADALPDVFVGGNLSQPGQIFYQQSSGSFSPQIIMNQDKRINKAAVFADFNGDKVPDLYVVNGGYNVREAQKQQDQLWLIQKGGTLMPKPLPVETENGSCVNPIDIDHDGDLDLFVGGSIKPFRFPAADESFLLVNDGQANFTKQSLGSLGLISDAVVTDINKDGWQDLVLVGEWMPVTILFNQKGRISSKEAKAYENLSGWWNQIEKADLDNDGDEDLIVGNLGLNTQVAATEQQPATLTYDDFDHNGTMDFIMSYLIQGKPYPAYSRDEICEQLPTLRKRFTSYKAYADASLETCFDEQQLSQAKTRKITELRTLVLENQNGELIPHALPLVAQYSPVFGIVADDFDHNGTTDLLLMGNNSQMRLRIGKVDANHGLVLSNRGKWQFEEISSAKTGLFARGDVRDLKKAGQYILVGLTGQKLKAFKQR
ncbi:VCBS repeat-containing protein [Spirosoma daeguense]